PRYARTGLPHQVPGLRREDHLAGIAHVPGAADLDERTAGQGIPKQQVPAVEYAAQIHQDDFPSTDRHAHREPDAWRRLEMVKGRLRRQPALSGPQGYRGEVFLENGDRPDGK